MSETRRMVLGLGLMLILGWAAAFAEAGEGDRVVPSPRGTAAKKWRIGYYEGGQYPDYEVILKATVKGLVALGWLRPLDLPPENNATPGGFWGWLVRNASSDRIEFVADGYYAAGNFDEKLRSRTKATLIKRLSEKRDIDLMIAMGTWAGQDLANEDHRTPVVVLSTSDPVGAGIVRSAVDSGLDHLHAKVEPERYARQLELFHDIAHFRRLGIVYEDTREGRTFAAVEAIEKTAVARNFQVVRCHAPFRDIPVREAERRVSDCYREIAKTADAVYVTVHRGVTSDSLPSIVTALNAAAIPSFSMLGENEVKQGILMSVAQGNYSYVGRFHAETIGRIINGAKPRSISQVWLAPAKIALNLKTAEIIGYDPPVDLLLATDEIYQTILGH